MSSGVPGHQPPNSPPTVSPTLHPSDLDINRFSDAPTGLPRVDPTPAPSTMPTSPQTPAPHPPRAYDNHSTNHELYVFMIVAVGVSAIIGAGCVLGTQAAKRKSSLRRSWRGSRQRARVTRNQAGVSYDDDGLLALDVLGDGTAQATRPVYEMTAVNVVGSVETTTSARGSIFPFVLASEDGLSSEMVHFPAMGTAAPLPTMMEMDSTLAARHSGLPGTSVMDAENSPVSALSFLVTATSAPEEAFFAGPSWQPLAALPFSSNLSAVDAVSTANVVAAGGHSTGEGVSNLPFVPQFPEPYPSEEAISKLPILAQLRELEPASPGTGPSSSEEEDSKNAFTPHSPAPSSGGDEDAKSDGHTLKPEMETAPSSLLPLAKVGKLCKFKMMGALSDEEWRASLQGATTTAFSRLMILSAPELRDNVLRRINMGFAADDLSRPRECYLVKRDNLTSRSPFQLQVRGARILAQKTIYTAYHNIPTTEMATWQVQQCCLHSDGSWWCFEPSHLEKRSHENKPNAKTKFVIPKPPDALYLARINPYQNRSKLNKRGATTQVKVKSLPSVESDAASSSPATASGTGTDADSPPVVP